MDPGIFCPAFEVFKKGEAGGSFHIQSPAFWLLLTIRRSSRGGLPIWNGQHQLELGNGCPFSWAHDFSLPLSPPVPLHPFMWPALTLDTWALFVSAWSCGGAVLLLIKRQKLGFTLPSKSFLLSMHLPFSIYDVFQVWVQMVVGGQLYMNIVTFLQGPDFLSKKH